MASLINNRWDECEIAKNNLALARRRPDGPGRLSGDGRQCVWVCVCRFLVVDFSFNSHGIGASVCVAPSPLTSICARRPSGRRAADRSSWSTGRAEDTPSARMCPPKADGRSLVCDRPANRRPDGPGPSCGRASMFRPDFPIALFRSRSFRRSQTNCSDRLVLTRAHSSAFCRRMAHEMSERVDKFASNKRRSHEISTSY